MRWAIGSMLCEGGQYVMQGQMYEAQEDLLDFEMVF